MKAVLHFGAGERLRRRIATLDDPRIVVVDEADTAGFAREIVDAQILLHVLEPVTAGMIAQAPRLRLIQKIGVGVNTIDLAAAESAGIAVANMPGTNTAAVAEQTLLLMLAALRRMVELDAITRAGRGWSLTSEAKEGIGEIAGAKIGLIGFGAVPRRLTPVLAAMGADVRFWNRAPRTIAGATALPFADLLATSDVVSLHLPLTADTRRILDRAAMASMKPGAIVVNTARGELIDQPALTEALRAGRIGGAGLDVFENEPTPDLAELAALPNVVLSPHIAWLTPQTWERSLAVVTENARRLQSGEALLNRIGG
jgi:phosphoglycerate dehydrogenase-like enzyme